MGKSWVTRANEIATYLSTISGGVAGQSTATLQTTGNTSLGNIDTQTDCLGTNTDAAASATLDEDTTARSVTSLLKGIKNILIDLSGCIIAGVSKTCGYNQTIQYATIAGPASASGAYSTYDLIGPATGATPATITGMALANGRGGTITMLRLTCNKKSVTPVIRVHFFNANNPTISNSATADNTQLKELYADISKRVGYYDLPALTTAADSTNSDCSRSQDIDVRIPYSCAAGSTSLYYCLELIGGSLTLSNGTEFTLVVKAMLN